MTKSIISRLLEGTLPDPDQNGRVPLSVPTKQVIIADSLADQEAMLVEQLALDPPYAVISDPLTFAALGRRVEHALSSVGPVISIRLGDRPHADMNTVNLLMAKTANAGSLIAVGSGTINDLCKYVASKTAKHNAVFATAPSMNGYTSVSAAISEHGLKKSLPATAPRAVFMDLNVLAHAPVRLIRSGLGDSICRSTAQADWLLSHLLLGSAYRQAPFALLAEDEKALLAEPEALLAGDLEAMARLARTLILSGFGMTICGGSFPASQGEHLISHHIEMKPPTGWVASFHGEQIAVTTCVMARLQEQMLNGSQPRLEPSTVTEQAMIEHFGKETGSACWKEFQPKRINAAQAEELNDRLDRLWPEICAQIHSVTVPPAQLVSTLQRAGAPTTFSDIDLPKNYFLSAVTRAREIRNRYTFLDLGADAGRLDASRLV